MERSIRTRVGFNGRRLPVQCEHKVRTKVSSHHSVRTEDDARAAVSLIKRILNAEGADSGGAGYFGMARTAETILKSHERQLKTAERRKELVPIEAVKGHVEKAFIGLPQAIQRLPSRHVPAIAA